MASGKPSIVTEVMQLYRFIVDKYSTMECKMPDGSTVMETLCQLLREMFNGELGQLKKVIGSDEGTILVQTILRILTQIVVRAPFSEMKPSQRALIQETCRDYWCMAILLAKNVELMWADEALCLVIALMRVQQDDSLVNVPVQDLLNSLMALVNEDTEKSKFFVLVNDITLRYPVSVEMLQ